ncbi:hypothetical protein [Halorussus halophilus]|nr:hypothetical protein [Halorussus halophilus]
MIPLVTFVWVTLVTLLWVAITAGIWAMLYASGDPSPGVPAATSND